MMFYNWVYLCLKNTSIDPHKEIYGCLEPPDLDKINEKAEKFRIKLEVDFLKLNIELNPSKTSATVTLLGVNKTTNNHLTLGHVKVTTTPANCGSIMIHELYAKYTKLGVGTYLLTEIERWAQRAGYSMIYGNIPNYKYTRYNFYKFFINRGFEPMGKPYINKRSGNLNHWFMKLLQEKTE